MGEEGGCNNEGRKKNPHHFTASPLLSFSPPRHFGSGLDTNMKAGNVGVS